MLLHHILYRSFIIPFLLCFLSCNNKSEGKESYSAKELLNSKLSDSIQPYVKYNNSLMAFTQVTLIDGTGNPI